MTHIHQNLEALRNRKGYSQEVVGAYLGVTHTIISNYEKGRKEPTHEHLSKLASFYDLEIADLFEENATDKIVNLAFAFRADAFEIEDLKSITVFKQIVKNYLKLHKINEAI